MLKNFFNQPNALGRFVIVLLLAGGIVFAGAFNGFVVQTQASSCCGGGTDASLTSSSCSCLPGDYDCGNCETSSSCNGTLSCGSGASCAQDNDGKWVDCGCSETCGGGRTECNGGGSSGC